MTTSFRKCSAPFSIKTCDPLGTFSGYASVFNELDDQGDRVMKGAFLKSLATMFSQGEFPKMLWQHDVLEPIGVWEEIREDNRGLFVKGRLVLDLRRAQEAYALMKERVLDGLSIGYRVIQAVKGKNPKERYLTQLNLFEISLVTFPANRAAKIINLKASGGNNDEEQLIQRIKQTVHILKS